MTLRTLLTLIRVPNLPTVAADVALGYCTAHALSNWSPAHWGTGSSLLAAGIVAGMLLYCGGMADNDATHAAKDQMLHKARPIVRGEVSAIAVQRLAIFFFVTGVTVAWGVPLALGVNWLVALRMGACAAAIAFGARTYNRLAAGSIGIGYRPPTLTANVLGMVMLGACRALLVVMGMYAWIAAFSPTATASTEYALFVPVLTIFASFTAITAVSLGEDLGGQAWVSAMMRGVLVMLIPWAGLFAWSMLEDKPLAEAPLAPGLLVLHGVVVGYRVLRAVGATRKGQADAPARVGGVVKWSIAADTLVAAAFLAAFGQTIAALVVAGLLLLCWVLGRVAAAT